MCFDIDFVVANDEILDGQNILTFVSFLLTGGLK